MRLAFARLPWLLLGARRVASWSSARIARPSPSIVRASSALGGDVPRRGGPPRRSAELEGRESAAADQFASFSSDGDASVVIVDDDGLTEFEVDLDEDDELLDDFDFDLDDDDVGGDDGDGSMADRIKAAQRADSAGSVAVPWFEAGKHGADERDEPAPKLPALALVTAADTCPGCGTRFQKDEALAPGFLPLHVWERLGLSDKRAPTTSRTSSRSRTRSSSC